MRLIKGLSGRQILIIIVSAVGLILMFLFQRHFQEFSNKLIDSKYGAFVLARTVRFILNDLLMILMIYGLFHKRKYVIFAFYVQVMGIVIILIPYLLIKSHTDYNGPLVSFMHRLVINPLLMVLLIPAFFYQESIEKSKKNKDH